jgi:hypothetical protein
MFKRDFKEVPGRRSFLDLPDLPVDLRNNIYELVLFGPGVRLDKLAMYEPKDCLLPWHREHGVVRVEDDIAIASLNLLGAVNKQIRMEARCLFWNKFHWQLHSDRPQHEALQRFLEVIGTEGKVSITESSPCSVTGSDSSPAGHTSFQKLLSALLPCKNLVTINLGVSVSNIFRSDVNALEAFLLRRQAMVSPGLEHFVNTITLLTNLTHLHLRMDTKYRIYAELEHNTERFLHFSFSGIRENMLVLEVKERFRAWHTRGDDGEKRKFNDRTWVSIAYRGYDEGDELMDYATWVAQYNKMYPKESGHDDREVYSD